LIRPLLIPIRRLALGAHALAWVNLREAYPLEHTAVTVNICEDWRPPSPIPHPATANIRNIRKPCHAVNFVNFPSQLSHTPPTRAAQSNHPG
jgi:hypothetical protein